MSSFGRLLREQRERAGLRQDDLAKLIGLSGARIGQFESRGDVPDPGTVFRLEEALGCTPGRLSVLLGYLPVDGAIPGVIDAINADDRLDDGGRQILVAVYERLIAPIGEA